MRVEAAPDYPPPRRAWFVVAVLALTYMFSFLDRQILVLLVAPIRADLAISDTEFSLLTGAAFALFYTIMAVPLSILADRWSRKRLIMIGVATWGAMTALCGLARGYGELFVARMGVGLGEATLTPTAYAMIPDLFAPERQARAMSVFVLGTFMGGGLSLLLGGLVIGELGNVGTVGLPLIGSLRPWQLVLLTVGAATLLMLVPLALIEEPARRGRPAPPRGGDASLRPALEAIWRRRGAYLSLFIGIPFASLAIYGLQAWLPSLFERLHGWTAAESGVRLGLVTLSCGVVGTLSGGFLADRWRAGGVADAAVRLNALLLAAAVPLPAVIGLVPTATTALAACALFFLVISMMIPLAPLALQFVTPPALRARTSALFLLVANLAGILCGPTVVALVTDGVFANDGAIGRSIALVGSGAFALAALVFWLGRPAYGRALAAIARA